MEERYPGFDASPLGPGDGDIERAAAAAAEQAADPGLRQGSAGFPGPRRWIVVGGVAVAALALAGTATALAVHKPPHTDVATVAGNASSTSATSDPSLQASSSSAVPTDTESPTTDESTTVSTSPTTKKSTPTKSATTMGPTSAGSSSLDCESESHDTPADAAMAFSGMQPGAQAAFLAAKAASKAAGIKQFILNSGYRSAAYQQRVFDCWVAELGSPQAARQFALPPSESAHVKGYAMDIAPPDAAAWLQSTAGKFGLCRRYGDEPWHFEYQAAYKTEGCPALLPHP